MTTVTAINEMERGLLGGVKTTPMRQSLRRWTGGLFAAAILGGVSGLGGLTIGILTMLEVFVPTTLLYTSSTVLIGSSFILFGLAAHSLDKADAADKAIRLDYCREHGLASFDDEIRESAK